MGALVFASAPVFSQDAEKPSAKEQKLIDAAMERGVDFLRKVQLPSGSFGNGLPTKANFGEGGNAGRYWPTAFAAFPGLALLECGVPVRDPAVQNAARFVRHNIPGLQRTYEISLAILFLDKLGNAEDAPLIRSLGLRLVAGQRHVGGWAYLCPVLTKAQEQKLLQTLKNLKLEENAKPFPLPRNPNNTATIRGSDHSNTQFAILGLWVARKHGLPLDYALAQVEKRFRSCQQSSGWTYYFRVIPRSGNGSMTCAGLLGLAVGLGSAPKGKETEEAKRDEGITSGLRALAFYMKDPSDWRETAAGDDLGAKGRINLYFLWSVERVGVFCNLKTIGGKDWYRWGADLLLRTQNPNGSWSGRGNGDAPVIDTSMALLFLKRSDLLPDLRETLQKRLKITDPGLDKSISPGEKSKPKSGTKSPSEKSDNSEKKSDLKRGIRKKEGDEKSGPQNRAIPVRGVGALGNSLQESTRQEGTRLILKTSCVLFPFKDKRGRGSF
jgi:hypothetical protein